MPPGAAETLRSPHKDMRGRFFDDSKGATVTISLPQLLTHSRLQSFRDCPRKHYYSYEARLRRDRESQPLRMGAAFHDGLDSRCRGLSVDDSILAACAGYEVIPIWAAASEESLTEWMIEREVVARLLSGYFWYWQCTDEHPLGGYAGQPIRIVASEQQFTIPIINPETGRPTPTFNYGGKLDKLVWWGADNPVAAVMEHKTAGEDIGPDADYWKRLRLDSQITGYLKGARQTGVTPTTVLYDVTRKPTIAPSLIPELDDNGFKIVVDAAGQRVFNKGGEPRQSANATMGYSLCQRRETPEEFGDRLTADIADRPSWYFQRAEIPRLESDIDDFDIDLWQQQLAVREAQKTNRWYRNAARCVRPYRCEYLDICHRGWHAGDPVPDGYRIAENVHEELEVIQ